MAATAGADPAAQRTARYEDVLLVNATRSVTLYNQMGRISQAPDFTDTLGDARSGVAAVVPALAPPPRRLGAGPAR